MDYLAAATTILLKTIYSVMSDDRDGTPEPTTHDAADTVDDYVSAFLRI